MYIYIDSIRYALIEVIALKKYNKSISYVGHPVTLDFLKVRYHCPLRDLFLDVEQLPLCVLGNFHFFLSFIIIVFLRLSADYKCKYIY